LPYHRVPGQWYTLLAVFTQTLPGAPAGVGALLAWLFAGVAGPALVAAELHDWTPPWPRQVPERVAPLKVVPSLQVAVTLLALCARGVPRGTRSTAAKIAESKRFRILTSRLSDDLVPIARQRRQIKAAEIKLAEIKLMVARSKSLPRHLLRGEARPLPRGCGDRPGCPYGNGAAPLMGKASADGEYPSPASLMAVSAARPQASSGVHRR
jgi:hypothetical protein